VTATPPSTKPPSGSLASRVIVAMAVISVFATLAWADATHLGNAAPVVWLLPIVLIVAAGGGIEVVRMAAARSLPLDPAVVAGGAAAIAAAPALAPWIAGCGPFAAPGLAAVAAVAVLIVAFAIAVAGYDPDRRPLVRVTGSVAAAIWIGLPLAFMVALRLHGHALPDRALGGLLPILSLIAVVKGSDTAAYAIGSMVGTHRMAPRLSPGKTWEGAAGGIVGAMATAWLVIDVLGKGSPVTPLGGWPLFGLCVGCAGILGDLAESLVKRELDAKDSGRSLFGMGGFLDLIDSLLLAAPVAWALWVAGPP